MGAGRACQLLLVVDVLVDRLRIERAAVCLVPIPAERVEEGSCGICAVPGRVQVRLEQAECGRACRGEGCRLSRPDP